MKTEILSSIARLSDSDLVARVKHLAGREREAMAEIIAHLGEIDARDLYAPRSPRPLASPRAPALARQPAASVLPAFPASALPLPPPPQRPAVTALAPERYKLQFTIPEKTLEKLDLAKDMLRHAVPSGDL